MNPIDIDNLTIGQAREIAALFVQQTMPPSGLDDMVGKKCIVRTYSAGVWYGAVSKKSGNEVIVTDARRLWRWWAAESISLSAVAIYGIKRSKSIVVPAVSTVWLEAIELIPCTDEAVTSIEGAPDAKAK